MPAAASLTVKTRYRSLPTLVNGMRVVAFVDTSCTTTLLSPKLAWGYSGSRTAIKAVDETEVKCRGTRLLEIELCGKRLTRKGIIIERIMNDIDIIIGMDGKGKLTA